MDHSKTKILYVPLDDRDCNYNFPYFLCQMTDDCEILRPPYEWMGKLKEPADCGRIWEWLFENVKDCQYCILSVDTLVYGHIICRKRSAAAGWKDSGNSKQSILRSIFMPSIWLPV